MTAADVWIYLFLSFFLGLGLGWWLFAGRVESRRTESSADAARERARSAPEPLPVPEPAAVPDESAPSAMQAIPSEALISLREQLEQAREARKGAEGLATRLDQQRRAALARESDARSRQESLVARLEQARGDRDHLQAEVEAARRTINRLEDASFDLPSAQLDPEAAPSPPMPLQGQRVQAPLPVPTRSVSSPTRTAQTLSAPKLTAPKLTAPKLTAPKLTAPKLTAPKLTAPKLTAPKLTAPKTTEGPPRVAVRTTSVQAKRPAPKSRGPVEVLFGPLSAVPVTPNTRSIPFELTARIKQGAPRDAAIEDLHIYLRFDLEDEGVAINGRRRGPLTLYKGNALRPSRPVIVQLGVSTGFHSDTPDANRPAAVPGDHRVVIKIEYRVTGEAGSIAARFAAAIPVTRHPA